MKRDAHSDAPRPDPNIAEHHQELIASLLAELFQSERSAEVHCEREAKRLGSAAPAHALLACAAHATRMRAEHERIAGIEEARLARGARAIGGLLSGLRAIVGDRLVDKERSFRATLLGLRHGIDTAKMLRHVADACGHVDVGGFCTRWLEEREPLVADVDRSMSWFAHHPVTAVEPAKSLNPLRWLRGPARPAT